MRRTRTNLIVVIGLSICLGTPVVHASSLEDGLIAWWRMELKQGDRIPDASGNCHDLAIFGSPTFNGNIVIFDDDGNLVAEDADDLDLLGDWSTSFWAREDSHDHSPNTNTSNGWMGKIRSYHDAEGGWFLNASDDNNVAASIYGTPNCSHTTDSPLTLGSWYRITTTYEAATNTLRIYLNDEPPKVFGEVSCPMLANTYRVVMGGYLESNLAVVPYCKGAMADVRIYDRALSECEIGELYSVGSPACNVQHEIVLRSGSCPTCEGTDPGVMVTSASSPEPQAALIWGGNVAPECDCGAEGQDPELVAVTTHSTGDTWGDFTTAFELPDGFADPTIMLRVRADDGAQIFLNEVLVETIDYTPIPGDPAVTHEIEIDDSGLFVEGTNTLRFYVVNTSNGHFGSPGPRGGPGDCMHVGFDASVSYVEGSSADCNSNGVHDDCDIADGASQDSNEDGVPDECQSCAADLNGDGVVGAADLAMLLASWGVCE